MSLVDMKITKADQKAEKEKYSNSPCSIGGQAGGYPYGLEVRLGDAELKKLGIDTLPNVGKKYTLTASVVVDSASSSARSGGKGERRVTFQITKMDLSAGSVTDAIDEVM